MKKIVCIDGGGIRGIIPALVLAEIERRTNERIAKRVDMIAGTSTGGLIALGLSVDDGGGSPKYSALDIVDVYERDGRKIFSRSLWDGISSVGGLLDEAYSHDGLESVLQRLFDNRLLDSALARTMVCTYDIEKREPFFFKSWREDRNRVPMRFAARATSAAPTYFEPTLVDVHGTRRALIDGGVFANNPAMCAYAEARKIWPQERDIRIVSIGTGELNRPIGYEEAKDWGRAGWLQPVLGCIFDGVSDTVSYQLANLLGASYIRLEVDLALGSDDLDDATAGNLANLRSDAQRLIRDNGPSLDRVSDWLKS